MGTKKLDRSLTAVKIQLMEDLNTTFITSVLFDLTVKWDETLNPPTAATNGKSIFLHPDYWNKLSVEERKGLLCHETWHVCFSHPLRTLGLDQKKHNIAADYVINIMIKDSGMKLPPTDLIDGKYRNWSVKEVYDDLKSKPNDGNKQGKLGATDIIYCDGDPEEQEVLKQEIADMVIKGMTSAELAGDDPGAIPGDIRRSIQELIDPVMPWEMLLQNFMDNFKKDDYTWRRPNKRYMPEFILPTQHSERVANITAAIDLSGSITDAELQSFLSELQYIQSTLQPEEMTILGFDTKISDNHTIKEGDHILDLKFTGGGGTAVNPVLKYIKKHKPTVSIIFTDFWVENDLIDPDEALIWIVIDNPSAEPPFGELAHFVRR